MARGSWAALWLMPRVRRLREAETLEAGPQGGTAAVARPSEASHATRLLCTSVASLVSGNSNCLFLSRGCREAVGGEVWVCRALGCAGLGVVGCEL